MALFFHLANHSITWIISHFYNASQAEEKKKIITREYKNF